ncbi:peroxiredoxin [Halobacterium salinarum]|uniref:Peroxiredoxin n=1 Tax=Halobacterium salinarum (strain ATCC 33171 / DSM 3754 / JCM 8978 / NBRC 102687 / NCIMB 764 / 91-R6) TaxID=2597657 RepID=A0A4D6GXP0_HALS9|nr:peroxiredoxin [Halobacterium salinarum]MCF2207207.1 peroxiredoxin [Halobacterium salinarum]MDL0125397.1 peroxiredoxin [Halobacterium salinarum]MDL0128917.1 peroxiredoxin [Halobacterium salinarum]MDL0140327.1 peroxiredoxin [Halobacterium salinarum]MDL0145923.1 peroxiredoxin [Halobacterium salinarum]
MELDFDVVDLPAVDHVAAGDDAPDFIRPLVTDEYWADVALADLLAEGPVVLVFTPMDGAFPATDMYSELRERGVHERAQVVGVSISTPYEHKTTIEDRGIQEFTGLFSDPQAGVAEAYGVEHDPDGMAGVVEHRPATVVIDADGTVEYAWVAQQWPEFPAYDELEAALDEL